MDRAPGGDRVIRTAVLGLGNPVAGDDRVGLAVAAAVADLLAAAPVPGVDVIESTRGGLELLDLLSGYDRAIIVDCVAGNEPSPGRVHRLALDRVGGSARLINAHEIGIGAVFRLGRELSVPMPASVDIIGIEGADGGTLSERMSPEVEAVVENLAREIHTSLAPRIGSSQRHRMPRRESPRQA